MWPWCIKRNNVISLARGLCPSKTPAASLIINSLSFSKGQQPCISNPKLVIWRRYAYAKILNIIAHYGYYPIWPYQFPNKLCFEIGIWLLRTVQGLQISVHNLLQITLHKHNYRERLIILRSVYVCISWSILARSIIYFTMSGYMSVDFSRFNSRNLWWSIPIETLTSVYFCFTETNEVSPSRDYQR